MTITDALILLGMLSLVLIAATAIPALLQLRRVFLKVEIAVDHLNRDLAPLAQQLTKTASSLEELSHSLNTRLNQADRVVATLQHSADVLLTASTLIRNSIRPVIANVGGFTAGVRAVARFLGRPTSDKRR